MARLLTGCLWFVLTVTVGCSTFHPAVQTEAAPYSDREQYRRFAFIRQTDSLHHEIDVPFRQVVEQVVTEQFAHRGYQLDAAHPEFLVVFHRFDKTTDLQLTDNHLAHWTINEGVHENSEAFSRLTTRKHRLMKDNVLLQVFDVAKDRFIWQGYTTRPRPLRHESESANTRYLVRSVIDRFPFYAQGATRNEQQAAK